MTSSKFFAYPLTKLFKIQWMNQHGSFSSSCYINVCVILKEVVQVNEKILLALKSLWQTIGVFFQKESYCAIHAPCSHHSFDDSLTICLHQYLILGRARKYNCVGKTLRPMMLTIPSKDTTIALCQLHPLPLNHVPPLIFYYQPKDSSILDKTLFA